MSLHLPASACCPRRRRPGHSRSRWPYSFSVDPQPAALITMVSTSAASASNASMNRRARSAASELESGVLASARRNSPGNCGMTTSQPSAASTRMVACVHLVEEDPLHAPEQQPDPSAPLHRPAGTQTSAGADQAPRSDTWWQHRLHRPQPGGQQASADRTRANQPLNDRFADTPHSWTAARSQTAAGRGRARRSTAGTADRSSGRCVSPSIDLGARGLDRAGRNCTPDGQAVTQDMQPRQVSTVPHEPVRDGGCSPSRPPLMSAIRPRGESVSLSPQQIGRAGRQTEPAVHAVGHERRVRRLMRSRRRMVSSRSSRDSSHPEPVEGRASKAERVMP